MTITPSNRSAVGGLGVGGITQPGGMIGGGGEEGQHLESQGEPVWPGGKASG